MPPDAGLGAQPESAERGSAPGRVRSRPRTHARRLSAAAGEARDTAARPPVTREDTPDETEPERSSVLGSSSPKEQRGLDSASLAPFLTRRGRGTEL